MGTARPSVTKRQREQLRRERQAKKLERRAERKMNPLEDTTVVEETPMVEGGEEPIVL